jgi:hypothetical protein
MSLFSRLFGSSKKQEPTPDPRAVLAEGEDGHRLLNGILTMTVKVFAVKRRNVVVEVVALKKTLV